MRRRSVGELRNVVANLDVDLAVEDEAVTVEIGRLDDVAEIDRGDIRARDLQVEILVGQDSVRVVVVELVVQLELEVAVGSVGDLKGENETVDADIIGRT